MNPTFELVLCAVGIASLFFLDRDKTTRPSKALWLPVAWLWINSSRPVSEWLGTGMTSSAPGLPATSSLDQAIAGSLMLLGVVVLRRRPEAIALLRASWPIVLYFSFALVSLSWSDYAEWGLKRWVRALGDVIMVLIIVTDAHPAAALRRVFSRLGFVLLPASILLVKYYPQLGRGFDPWGAVVVNTGVTTNKNTLGAVAYVITLGTLWQVVRLLRDKNQPDRRRRLLAQGTLLAFGVWVLQTAHSSTSGTCFALGAGLMLLIARPTFRARPAAVHALVFTVLLGAGLTVLLGGEAAVARAVGRKPSLSGRTAVWNVVIPMAPNPVGGAGFETFWMGPRLDAVADALMAEGANGGANEAHNGYIEMYLNLGWIGLGLIALILGHGYRKAVAAFRHDPVFGGLLLAYVVTAIFYNITEAGFRMGDPPWFFLLLAIVASGLIARHGASWRGRGEGGTSESSLPSGCDTVEFDPAWADIE